MPYLDYNVSASEFYPIRNTRYGKNMDLVTEFVASGKPIAELRLGETEYASATSAYTVFKDAIDRLKLSKQVKVFTRYNRLFIMRLDKEG